MGVMQRRSRSRRPAGKRPSSASTVLRCVKGGACLDEPATNAADQVTFIPSPRVVVRHPATGVEMGVFPMTAHKLAHKIATRWRGSAELLPVEPAPLPSDRSPAGGSR
jgi:hypothetical protein